MVKRRWSLVLGLALTVSAVAGAVAYAAPANKIRKPTPTAPVLLPPLPPAIIDDTLVIGGNNIKAR